jgi:hypothetical protein
MLSKEILLMSKKLYRKIRQIVPEWLQRTMVVVVAVVCVDHHREWGVDGDLWVANPITVEVVAVEAVATDLVVVVVAAVAMEQVEIIVVDLDLMVVVMVVIWV